LEDAEDLIADLQQTLDRLPVTTTRKLEKAI